MERWKTVEPGVWKPQKEGDHIMGILVNKEPKDDTSGLSARYYLENDQGMFFVWGCAVLDGRMQYVKIGDKIKITYQGETTNKRNQKVNLYKVDVAEGHQSKNNSDADTGKNGNEPMDVEQIKEVK